MKPQLGTWFGSTYLTNYSKKIIIHEGNFIWNLTSTGDSSHTDQANTTGTTFSLPVAILGGVENKEISLLVKLHGPITCSQAVKAIAFLSSFSISYKSMPKLNYVNSSIEPVLKSHYANLLADATR